jgi:hypothetical protein
MVVEIMLLLALMKCMIWSEQFMDIFLAFGAHFATDSGELDKSDRILMFLLRVFLQHADWFVPMLWYCLLLLATCLLTYTERK